MDFISAYASDTSDTEEPTHSNAPNRQATHPVAAKKDEPVAEARAPISEDWSGFQTSNLRPFASTDEPEKDLDIVEDSNCFQQPNSHSEWTKSRAAPAYDTDLSDDGSSSGDSEFEFELNVRSRSVMTNHSDAPRREHPPRNVFDPEYYKLPPIENISLEDKQVDKSRLKPLGSVASVIDFVVTIKPNPNVPSLDYDTVIFNDNADALGTIFEIFGLITEPMYAIRFNSAADANRCQPGMSVLYDPENYQLTHTVFPDSIIQGPKPFDEGEQEPDFSDDEAEREYRQKVRAKAREVPALPAPAPKRVRPMFWNY